MLNCSFFPLIKSLAQISQQCFISYRTDFSWNYPVITNGWHYLRMFNYFENIRSEPNNCFTQFTEFVTQHNGASLLSKYIAL